MTTAEASFFTIGDDVLCQTLGDKIVLLNLASREYFALDGVGARTWQLLVQHGNVVVAAEQLCNEYSVGFEEAKRDVEALASELRVRELLIPVAVDARLGGNS